MVDASCETCTWWCRGGAQIAKAQRDPGTANDIGTCQIDPPTVAKIVGGWVEAVFPTTHASRFCSSWDDGEGDDGGDGGGEQVSVAPIATDTVVAFERRSA